MKKYIKNQVVLSAIKTESDYQQLSESQMLDLFERYTTSEGNYGPFANATEMSMFFNILDRLEELGYEV